MKQLKKYTWQEVREMEAEFIWEDEGMMGELIMIALEDWEEDDIWTCLIGTIRGIMGMREKLVKILQKYVDWQVDRNLSHCEDNWRQIEGTEYYYQVGGEED